MADYIKVSAHKMEKDAEEIKRLLETLPQLVRDLEQAMHELSNCWEGVAWSTYQQSVVGYMEELAKIYEDMGKYVVNMQNAAMEYMKAEQEIHTSIRRI